MTETPALATLQNVIKAVPEWVAAESIETSFVSGGITNNNFCVRVDGTPYFVRLPGEQTEALGIDREHERRAARTAAALGIGPRVVAFMPEQKAMVTEWLDGATLSASDVRDPATLEATVRSLASLHRGPDIPGTFSPFRIVEVYRASAESKGVQIPEAYHRLAPLAHEIETAFSHHPEPAVPCHNDLLPSNFLRQGERVAIVDYEYAGMGDPYFDLGNLSVNNDFDQNLDEQLLRTYFGGLSPRRTARLKLMRLMSDFREAMWGVIQQALSTLDFDYVDYADQHFSRCLERAEDKRYSTWLADATIDP